MSLAENLLNSLDETAYQNSRIAGIEPEEEHIKVGQDRVITVPNVLKTIAVKGDKDVETATIDCVRYWDGHDLSTFAIYLNYILPNGDEGTYIPKGISKAEDTFSFDWQIGSEFTYAQGKMSFWIVAKLTDDSGTLIKQWSSFQNSDCTIAQGGDKIYVPEKQTDQDVISQAISISRASAEHAEQQANLAIEAANKAALDASHAAEEEVSRIIGELGVVQELGDSPNSVVSQLKVTKEFNQTNAKVNRNSKRITNIEQGLPEELFVTEDSVAYQKDVPANSLPYAEIKKIGGMTYKYGNILRSAEVTKVKSVGANVSDITTPRSGYFYDADGSQSTADAGNICFYVQNVQPNTQYTLSCNLDFYSVWLDDGQNAIGSKIWVAKDKKATITTNANTHRLRVSVYNTSGVADTVAFEWFMINKGETALPYTSYKEHSLPIPSAVQALDGYGQGNPDDTSEYNAIVWDDNGNASYQQKGNITNGVWVALATTKVTDISDLITSDNLLSIRGNGTLTFENEYGYAVPSEVEYQVEV